MSRMCVQYLLSLSYHTPQRTNFSVSVRLPELALIFSRRSGKVLYCFVLSFMFTRVHPFLYISSLCSMRLYSVHVITGYVFVL